MPNIAPRVYADRRPQGMAAPGVKKAARCALCARPAVTAVGEHRLCGHHERKIDAVVQSATGRRQRAVDS